MAVALAVSALAFEIDSYWIPGTFAAVILAYPLVKRYPSALILPVVFSGEFKEVRGGLDRLNALDPTLVAIAFLTLVVLLRLSGDLVRGDSAFLDAAASNWKGVILYLGLTAVISASLPLFADAELWRGKGCAIPGNLFAVVLRPNCSCAA